MNLYDSITRRKACRQYDMTPLRDDILQDIEKAIASFDQLYTDAPITYRFTSKVKGRFTVQAPHYLVICGSGKAGEQENAGFLFEQLALWFDAMDLGCVWLGGPKDANTQDTKNDIIMIGFGRTTEPVHRSIDEFKRNDIATITNTPDDVYVQAAHLAPSGMNTQPWYFEKQGDKVLVYKQKLKPHIALIYKNSDIDMGIGLCHYALACKENGKPFQFERSTELPTKAGYFPFGILS